MMLAALLGTGGMTACATGANPTVRASAATAATAASAATGTANAGMDQAAPPPDSPPATRTASDELTAADDHATVRLHVGQSVTVMLAPDGLFQWHVPTVSGIAVRQVSDSGGYPGQEPARATFLAQAGGEATLQAVDDTACLHAQPGCKPPQRQWQVTVTVTE
jgi:hypothetical protein